MKVVTVRTFRDRASEMFRSDDVILVTREGRPAGFFLPWDAPELPADVRREVFLRLTDQIRGALSDMAVPEFGDIVAGAHIVLPQSGRYGECVRGGKFYR